MPHTSKADFPTAHLIDLLTKIRYCLVHSKPPIDDMLLRRCWNDVWKATDEIDSIIIEAHREQVKKAHFKIKMTGL
jgi:hypothetical protein